MASGVGLRVSGRALAAAVVRARENPPTLDVSGLFGPKFLGWGLGRFWGSPEPTGTTPSYAPDLALIFYLD